MSTNIPSPASVYTKQFFAAQVNGSSRSADRIVPLVVDLIKPASVIDVGCGVGSWLAEFAAAGLHRILGLDGAYVDRSRLLIPQSAFEPTDLSQPLRRSDHWDLAVSLEVAEHLPAERAKGFVEDLVSLSPCVLFSAAVPGQGGDHHINEQHLAYWVELFAGHGYVALDAIRPRILGDSAVEWWYQQNIVLFVPANHRLAFIGLPLAKGIIHPVLFERYRNPAPLGVRGAARAFLEALGMLMHRADA